MKKYSIEDMQKIAISRGGDCVSIEYVNNKTKLKWRCSKGHEWEAVPSSIMRGKWCPYCAKKIKLTIEEMREIAVSRGGECLSNEYVNARTKLKWRCQKGHEWEAIPDSVKRGRWCPFCAGNVLLTIKNMQEIAKERNGKCLSKNYINNNTKLRWQCSEGHEWEATPGNIKSGKWCPVCAIESRAEKQRDTIENMRRIAKKRNGECLSDCYVNTHTSLIWKCSEGHIWKATPNSIKSGSWCPHCRGRYQTIEEMQEIALSRGGKCLSHEYHDAKIKMKWRCSDGHVWEATPGNIKRGKWCPICSQGVSERICRATFERIFREKFPKKHPKWLINPNTGSKLELDGYCKSLGIAFEFQGIHHYQQSDFFHSKTPLKERKKLDRLKRDLCIQHEIILIEVPYMEHNKIAPYIIAKCNELKLLANPIGLDAFDYRSFDVYSPHRIEEMQKIARLKGGECLSKDYINDNTKLKWRCEKHHEWEATPGNIKQGKWCPICGIKKRARKHRTTIEEIREIAQSRDGLCLSTEYSNSNNKLRWRCSEGHEWDAVLSSIKSGSWCPICGQRKSAEKQRDSIENMKKIAKSRGGECLSQRYINSNTHLRWRCSETHEWVAKPYNIKQGKWCPICGTKKGADKLRDTIGNMKKIAQSRGGECLSDMYVNNRTKLKWKCSEGHTWENTSSHIKDGQWCPYCANVQRGIKKRDTIENMRKIANERNGFCLSDVYVNNRTKLKWKCSEGHEWEALPNGIKRGSWCPVCARKKQRKRKKEKVMS